MYVHTYTISWHREEVGGSDLCPVGNCFHGARLIPEKKSTESAHFRDARVNYVRLIESTSHDLYFTVLPLHRVSEKGRCSAEHVEKFDEKCFRQKLCKE